jgi:uncharacterized protein YegP (UPF0339 family)
MNRTTQSLLLSAALLAGFAALPSGRPAVGADAAADKASTATFEVYQDKAGEFRWRLRTQNGQVIATSGDGYKEKRSCMAGIESVKKNAPGAAVKEEAAPAAK